MSINCLGTYDDPQRFRADFKAIRTVNESISYLQDQIAYLDLVLDPCWQPMEYWIAYRERGPAGRVGARLSSKDPHCGFIGLLATTTDIEGAARTLLLGDLLAVAINWLKAKGVRTIYAPVDCNTWLRFRLIAGGTGALEQTFGWEPPQDPELRQALRQTGFDELEVALGPDARRGLYHSRAFKGSFSRATRALEPHYVRALKDGFTFRGIGEGGRSFQDELVLLHRIAVASFSRQFLFEPIDLRTFARIYSMSSSQLDISPSAFIMNPDAGTEGEAVGFMFAFVDRGYVVVKTVAVLPEIALRSSKHRWSAASALLYLALRHGEKTNLQGGISALVHDEGSATTLERWMSWASMWTRRYELLALKI